MCDKANSSNKEKSEILRQCERVAAVSVQSINIKPGEVPWKTQVATEKKMSEVLQGDCLHWDFFKKGNLKVTAINLEEFEDRVIFVMFFVINFTLVVSKFG